MENLRVWYRTARQKREARSTVYRTGAAVVMALTIPTGIFALGCYDVLMAPLAVFGYVPSAM